ncbi:MAG: nucleoside deaminase [Clostridia bacterium]|nr:nucleoside deaminase [Clostridia bacterium]
MKKLDDEYFMSVACELSEKALNKGNEPFGALLVKDNEIILKSENSVNSDNNPLEHAEIKLLREFIDKTGITDLCEYTLFSSCEPCFMCSGAISRLRVGRLVYGATHVDLEKILGKKGCSCSKIVFENSSFSPKIVEGVLRVKCCVVLEKYFKIKK